MSLAQTTGATDSERLARVTLSLAAEPGDPVINEQAHLLGGEAFLEVLRRSPEHRERRAAAAARLDDVDPARELARAAGLGIRFVVPGDAEWPAQLDDLAHAEPLQDRGGVPVGLWVRGPLRLDQMARSVAVVGSRTSTMYGDQLAAELAAFVGAAGRPVVSGGAFGIDYAAHRGALSAHAPTVAVLACGVDRAYPAAHRQLIRHLGENHAVVSEAPPGAGPFRVRFLARNRLIAAFAQGTVVVEAAARSGALNTANWADRLSRVVMGTPGPVTSATSVGVLQLIRSGAASLVTGGADVLELLGGAGEHLAEEPRGHVTGRDGLRLRERQVLDAVPVAQPAGTESIARVAGLAEVEVFKALERLQRGGLVERFPRGWRVTDLGRG